MQRARFFQPGNQTTRNRSVSTKPSAQKQTSVAIARIHPIKPVAVATVSPKLPAVTATEDRKTNTKLDRNYQLMRKEAAKFKQMVLEDEKKPVEERRTVRIDPDAIGRALDKAEKNHKRSIYG